MPRATRSSSWARTRQSWSATCCRSNRPGCRRDDGSCGWRGSRIRPGVDTRVRGRDRPRMGARTRDSLYGSSRRDRGLAHQTSHSPRRHRRAKGGSTSMRIEIFLDDESVPRQTLRPPTTLELDTEGLTDGPHRLRVHAIGDSGTVGVEEIPFTVRNGPGIAVVGLSDGDTVRGRVALLVNALASRPGEAFAAERRAPAAAIA